MAGLFYCYNEPYVKCIQGVSVYSVVIAVTDIDGHD